VPPFAPSGELDDDGKILDATDRNGDTYKLALAIGDRVRLYDRVHDARVPGRKTVLANNGEVVEIRALTEEGMIVPTMPASKAWLRGARSKPAGTPRCA
jgi:hypothetical protein